MASSKVVTTNPDLPRDSSISSLSTLLTDLHHHNTNTSIAMDDLLKSIYTPEPSSSLPKTVDEVWNDIVTGTQSQSQSQSQRPVLGAGAGEASEEMTLEDFLTKAGAVREEDVRVVPSISAGIHVGAQFAVEGSSVEAFGNGVEAAPASASGGGKGKRRALGEPADKATLQKQRRMIKNRESAARSRERKQAYTVELEYLVTQLEEENARLLTEEADQNKQRFKQLMECLIPVVEKRKPRRMLQRTNSVQW